VTEQTFTTTASHVFAVDAEARTIKGVVLPFNVVGENPQGKFTFSEATDFALPADVSRVKLNLDHNPANTVGYATALDKTADGIVGTFKVARGSEGDRALSLAEDHVYDGLSAELGKSSKFAVKDGVAHGATIALSGVALTPRPAFDDARVTSVAASKDGANTKEVAMGDENPAPESGADPEAAPQEFARQEDLNAMVATAVTAAFAAIPGAAPGAGIPPREVVPAGLGIKVNEPQLYRFDGKAGQYDYSTDMFAFARGDSEAGQRLADFNESIDFAAVTQANVSSLQPTYYRPDLYVAPPVHKTPIADAITTGDLQSGVPFIIPSFATSGNMVNTHVEGVEPTDGTFTTGSLTVTPSALDGLIEVNREVVDAGGNPQTSALIWAEVQRQWAIARENAAAAVLTGSAAAELGAAFAGTEVDTALTTALESKLSVLAFSDYAFAYAFGHIDLYGKLNAAKDGNGRKVYPIINPQNASGTVAERYQSMAIGGYPWLPAAGLGATGVNKKSYLVDPSAIGFWMSATPKRIALPETTAMGLRFGIFGYKGGGVLDVNRIAKVTY
jgi:hypothetical protein